ncbi:MAG: protein-methionine-sulfoxide reductase heme-binding subunit MsrQ [Paracoccaceae bacterium]|nr:protein-methionine-sulfoxide reductase heme-binding subunit MsrQ [Paracoccaceae bacterium]
MSQRVNGALRRVPTWPVYAIGGAVPLYYFYLGLTGGLGPEPVKALEHALGLLALQMLVAVLAVTPLRDLTGVSLVKFRRALGLLVAYFVTWHLGVWFFLDVQFLGAVWEDITKRPYITIGMLGFVLLIPLAATSTNRAIRKMGPLAWRRLHRLTYAVALLGAVHFVMASKTWATEPLVYLGVICGLLIYRLRPFLAGRSAARA